MNLYLLIILGFFNFFSKEPTYQKLSDGIIEKQRREILIPRKMNIVSLGGGNDEGIRTVHVGVATKGPGSINESRKLLVFLVDDLIKRYNSDKNIYPLLTNYPYTPNNITYVIWYQNPEGRFWLSGDLQNTDKELAHVAMYRGKIKYNILKEKDGFLKETFCETYDEAKKILEEEYEDYLRL